MNTKNNRFIKILLASSLVFAGLTPLAALADNPIPMTTSISPSVVAAGSGAFTLVVNGNNFVAGSVVNINGNARLTAYISPAQLTASIPASDVSTMGTFNVTVTNPAPGGGTSNALGFAVVSPITAAPIINSISPTSVTSGSGAFTLTVFGSNFVPSSAVSFNGFLRATNYVSANQLTAVIPASDVGITGVHAVRVVNPAVNGGSSNAVLFAANPIAAIPGLPNTGFGPSDQVSGWNVGLLAGGIGLLGALLAMMVTRKVLRAK